MSDFEFVPESYDEAPQEQEGAFSLPDPEPEDALA